MKRVEELRQRIKTLNEENTESLMQKEMEEMRQRIKTLKEKENYEDVVTSTNNFCLSCTLSCSLTNELSNKTYIPGCSKMFHLTECDFSTFDREFFYENFRICG